MCGIVGYIGTKDARNIIIKGLESLEYRGYDSAGVALESPNGIKIFKDKGRINHLKDITDYSFETTLGIGHTRWATHGEVNQINSHPHVSNDKRFTLVHNGVIENYRNLKLTFLSNYSFESQTDSEVIVNLLEFYSHKYPNKSVEEIIRKTISKLEGSYALLIIDNKNLNKLYCVKNKTPMLIGVSDSGIIAASDMIAFTKDINKYFFMEDQRIAVIDKNGSITQLDLLGNIDEIVYKDFVFDSEESSKGQYDHYMLKEIEEQPLVLRRLIQNYFDGEEVKIDENLINEIRNCDKINFVACGTSYYASLLGKYFFEKLCGIPTECFVASELVYSTPMLTKKPLFIFVTQSGETADLIAITQKVRAANYKMLTITNCVTSTISHCSDYVLDIYAGKEISVASTKAYTAQIALMAILARAVSAKKTNLKNNLNKAIFAIEDILANDKPMIQEIAKCLIKAEDAFYIGRGIDYWACQEAALKLKEISYIHTEAFSSGELKHGTIALIAKDTPVLAIVTQEGTNAIVRSNLEEVKARGAKTFIISMESTSYTDDDIIVPNIGHYLSPLLTVVISQLIAYYAAVMKNNDVDKPKNLAKSVTVE